MPTLITHALVGASVSALASKPVARFKLITVLAIVAVLPDIDVLGFRNGIPYSSLFGLRGFTHSLPFAALVGLLSSLILFPEFRRFSRQFWNIALLVGLATASHGILDAFTNAGLGIGFFIPFDDTRYFMPWRPLTASPLSFSRFLSGSGIPILVNEMKWVGIPIAVMFSVTLLIRWLRGRRGA